jgi:hypothetical protein
VEAVTEPTAVPPLEFAIGGWVINSAEVSGPGVEVGTSVMRVRGVDGEVVLDLSGPGDPYDSAPDPDDTGASSHLCGCPLCDPASWDDLPPA